MRCRSCLIRRPLSLNLSSLRPARQRPTAPPQLRCASSLGTRGKPAATPDPLAVLEEDERKRHHGHRQESEQRRSPGISEFRVHLSSEQRESSFPRHPNQHRTRHDTTRRGGYEDWCHGVTHQQTCIAQRRYSRGTRRRTKDKHRPVSPGISTLFCRGTPGPESDSKPLERHRRGAGQLGRGRVTTLTRNVKMPVKTRRVL